MEIGEAIAVLVGSTPDNPCPFCASDADPKPEKKEMVNDSAELADNLGGMPYTTMRHPEGNFDVYDPYYVSDNISRICLNAHHVIPGNASLGNCPQILEWMAGTTTIKKKFYDNAIKTALKNVNEDDRPAARAQLVAAKFPNSVIYGPPDMRVTFSTQGAKAAVHREKTVSTNKVYGAISFEVNAAQNGVWLPSNNAVNGWQVMATETAKNSRGRSMSFPGAYASNAMRVTKRQFHDAHDPYSTEVTEKLREISMELRKLAEACLFHDDPNSKKDGRYHAPERLTGALYTLAVMIVRDKLNLETAEAKPAQPWVTSDLSDRFGEKY